MGRSAPILSCLWGPGIHRATAIHALAINRRRGAHCTQRGTIAWFLCTATSWRETVLQVLTQRSAHPAAYRASVSHPICHLPEFLLLTRKCCAVSTRNAIEMIALTPLQCNNPTSLPHSTPLGTMNSCHNHNLLRGVEFAQGTAAPIMYSHDQANRAQDVQV